METSEARRRIRRALRLAAATLVALVACQADASDYFGPSEGFQFWPELDAIVNAGDSFRIIGKLEPSWIPSQDNFNGGYSVYGDWLVAPFMPTLVTPDLAKRRHLDVRLGLSWYPTYVEGTVGSSNLLQVELETTAGTDVPGGILVTLRYRVEARWQLDAPTSFTWRLRLRPQLEREFILSREARTSLTPFANVEFIWTTAQDMWDQVRMQAGLQLGVNWFWKGQLIEVNGQIVTFLQPTHSYAPVLGIVWYQYF
jgi:hypothetical protein